MEQHHYILSWSKVKIKLSLEEGLHLNRINLKLGLKFGATRLIDPP